MKLSNLTLTQREAIITSGLLIDAFGRLGVMESIGVEHVADLLRAEFAASIDDSQPCERAAYHHLIGMVMAFRDADHPAAMHKT